MATTTTFNALAVSIKRTHEEAPENPGVKTGCIKIAHDIADHFALVNPRFKRSLFMTACGLEGY
jgi:hypothetical protein